MPAWCRGVSPELWNQGIGWFLQVGFDEIEAVAWLTALEAAGGRPDRRTPFRVCEYRDAGFAPDEAVVWVARGFPTYLARPFADAGWGPDQARALIWLYGPRWTTPGAAERDSGTPADRACAWLTSGLPPDRVLRLAAAGITLAELRAEPGIADTDEETLTVLAALRADPRGRGR